MQNGSAAIDQRRSQGPDQAHGNIMSLSKKGSEKPTLCMCVNLPGRNWPPYRELHYSWRHYCKNYVLEQARADPGTGHGLLLPTANAMLDEMTHILKGGNWLEMG